MRITESRMIDLAAGAVSSQRDRAAAAGSRLTSGIRNALPSDDLVAWAEGQRAKALTLTSQHRGTVIQRATEQLSQTDQALATISNVLVRARELAIAAANGTTSAEQRQAMATEVRTLRSTALAAANAQGADGTYLLSGSQNSAPFDATGAYVGDNVERTVEVASADSRPVTITGERLTAAAGVDVFSLLDTIATTMANNDQAGTQATLDDLGSSVDQVSLARAEVGTRLSALQTADTDRGSLEQHLAEVSSRALETDAVAGASDLAHCQVALQTAQTVADQIVSLTRLQ